MSAQSRKRSHSTLSQSSNRPSASPSSKRTRPDSSFVYDDAKSAGNLSHQVRYGPAAQLGKTDMNALKSHYGGDVGSRLTQYATEHKHYVNAAGLVGRSLTIQEHKAKTSGRNAPASSINHVIASGTGQNLLNRMTLEFAKGKNDASVSKSPRVMLKGLAMQAAAVGRMTGVGRAILAEEHENVGYGKTLTGTGEARRLAKRNRMMGDVLNSFQGDDATRMQGYRRYMKHTFDSFGNLRVGVASGNGRVSTGFDMPLDHQGNPTAWGQRLLGSLHTFGLPDMLEGTTRENTNYKSGRKTTIRTGVYTTNAKGQNLSSSKEVK